MKSYFPLNQFLEDLEVKIFNILGYIPIVSSISGAFRCLLGKFEILGGLIFGTAKALVGILTSNERAKQAHFSEAGFLFSYILHGFLNILRGLVEMIPLLGLILCLPYDRLFLVRFRYRT